MQCLKKSKLIEQRSKKLICTIGSKQDANISKKIENYGGSLSFEFKKKCNRKIINHLNGRM